LNFGILLILFVLSGFFSAAETALFSLSKLEKRRLTDRHPHLIKLVSDHLDHPRRTLVTILIGNLLVTTLATSMTTLITLHFLGPHFLTPALVLFTLALIFFGEIIPKTLAVRKNETVAAVCAIPLRVFSALFYPFRWCVRLITDWILKFLLPDRKEHSDQISEEELKTLIKIGEEEGVLDRDERHMLQKVLELGERPVKDIMTPRIDLAAINIEDPREKQIELLRKYHFAYFPVYQNTIDNMLGVVSVQEFMLNANLPISNLLKQPFFIPELKPIDDLLAVFKNKNQSFAVCVDEYGGTAGIVTLEDILEEVFGEFYDEYAKVENPIRSLGNGEYIVEAKIPLADFNEYFSFKLEAQDASTLGGFVLEKMGEVPEKGKILQVPECEIRIHDVIRQRRIRSVIVRPKK